MLNMIRVTRVVLKFIDLLKNKRTSSTNVLEVEDLTQAEDLWVKFIQFKSLP